MSEQERHLLRYLSALDHGDFDTIQAILQLAEHDSVLDMMIRDVHSVMEEGEIMATYTTPMYQNGHMKTIRRDLDAQNQSRPHAIWTGLAAVVLLIVIGCFVLLTPRNTPPSTLSQFPAVEATADPQVDLIDGTVISAGTVDQLTVADTLPRFTSGGAATWINAGIVIAEDVGGLLSMGVSADDIDEQSTSSWWLEMNQRGHVTALDAEGDNLIAGYHNGRAIIWEGIKANDLQQYADIHELPAGPGPVKAVSMDSTVALIVYDDRTMVYDVDTGEWVLSLQQSQGALAADANNWMLAFADKLIRYNQSGGIESIMPIDEGTVTAFTASGTSMYVGFQDGHVSVYHVDGMPEQPIKATGQPVTTLTVTGDTMAVGYADGAVSMVQDGIQYAIGAEDDVAQAAALIIPPEENTLIVTYPDGKFALYEITTGELIDLFTEITASPIHLDFAPDESHLAVAQADSITVWQLPMQSIKAIYEGHRFFEAYLPESGVSVDPFGALRVPDFENDAVLVWDSNRILRRFSLDPTARSEVGVEIMAIDERLGRIAVGRLDGQIQVIDMQAEAIITRIDAHDHQVTALAFSPDGTLIASASQQDAVFVWDVETGEQVYAMANEAITSVHSLDFSPRGQVLVVGGMEGIGLIDLSADEHISRSVEGWAADVTFNTTGDLVAYVEGWSRQDVRLCTLQQFMDYIVEDILDCQHTLTHPLMVTDITFSDNGTILATASADGIRLWQVASER